MSFKRLFLALTCVVSLSLAAHEGEKEAQWGKFVQKYGASLALGTAIGAASGTACFHMDQVIPFPIDWFLWYAIRWQTISSCEETLREADIEFDAGVVENSAWAAAWLSYFTVNAHYACNPVEKVFAPIEKVLIFCKDLENI